MLFAVDKPKGMSSFDVIRILQKHFPKGTKIGHSGTLDPLATGLLIVATDQDTKKLAKFLGADKSYETTIDFSKISDTRDSDYWKKYEEYQLCWKQTVSDTTSTYGVISTHIRDIKHTKKAMGIIKDGNFIPAPSKQQIQKQLDKWIPTVLLPIPTFSAKKKSGKKLYSLARSGVIQQEYKQMKIYKYIIVHYKFPLLQLTLDVGSGTYIRSIAYQLGKQFGLGGIVTQLRRTRIDGIQITSLVYDQKIDTIPIAKLL